VGREINEEKRKRVKEDWGKKEDGQWTSKERKREKRKSEKGSG
jgi:hypothetical protein